MTNTANILCGLFIRLTFSNLLLQFVTLLISYAFFILDSFSFFCYKDSFLSQFLFFNNIFFVYYNIYSDVAV